MSQTRQFKTFYSRDLRQANSTRYSARGSAASLRGAMLAAVAKLHDRKCKRVDIYGRSGRLLVTVFAQDGRITAVHISAKSGKLHHVDSELRIPMTNLYTH